MDIDSVVEEEEKAGLDVPKCLQNERGCFVLMFLRI